MSERAPDGRARIRAAFASAAEAGRSALVAYVMAGFPGETDAVAAGDAALRCGAGLPSGFKLNASSSTCVVLTTGLGAHDVNYREA